MRIDESCQKWTNYTQHNVNRKNRMQPEKGKQIKMQRNRFLNEHGEEEFWKNFFARK